MDRALADLETLRDDCSLWEAAAYGPRCLAIERLEYAIEVLGHGGRSARASLRVARALRSRLEGANAAYAAGRRAALIAGTLSPAGLRAELDHLTGYRSQRPSLHLEHEPADMLVDGILDLDRFRGEPTLEDRDYVHLEDSPVAVLLDLVDHVTVGPGDVLFDLGSGLGRAAILLHWLTGAPAEGVEVQPEYHAFACRLAAELGLGRVAFQLGDAREADLSRGTVFYLFTPFRGRIQRQVWDRLAEQAVTREITVCTYGSVSMSAAHEPWLAPDTGEAPHEFSLCVWRAGPT